MRLSSFFKVLFKFVVVFYFWLRSSSFLRSSSIFLRSFSTFGGVCIPFFWGRLSSWVIIRLDTKTQLFHHTSFCSLPSPILIMIKKSTRTDVPVSAHKRYSAQHPIRASKIIMYKKLKSVLVVNKQGCTLVFSLGQTLTSSIK